MTLSSARHLFGELCGRFTHPVRCRQEVGVSQLVWGSGFGHARSYWPHSHHEMERCFAGVRDNERDSMLAGNVIEFFHLQEDTSRTTQQLYEEAHAR
jgi:hypothetical protein